MSRKKHSGITAEKFIDETVRLIEKHGGSTKVNLREIAKSVGCAHTNAYNYFEGFEQLMWAAFEKALRRYADAIVYRLDSSMSAHAYFTRVISNMVGFAEQNPGLYRFISTDPLATEKVPEQLIDILTQMKGFFIDVVHQLSAGSLTAAQAQEAGDILLAYLDGETLSMINGRYLPGDNISERIVGNAVRLYTLLTSRQCDGVVLPKGRSNKEGIKYPVLVIES